jgi:hypothetical protein
MNNREKFTLKQMIESNIYLDDISLSSSLSPSHELKEFNLLDFLKKINIYLTILIIALGLIGHSVTISIYSRAKNRRSSGNVYLLCLALNDSLFLIVHFLEDTLRSFKSIFFFESNEKRLDFISKISISDRFNFTCGLFNYLRNVLRFISAYIIVAFTVQRLLIIYLSPKSKFRNTKAAWIIVSIIVIIGLLINSWVPFFFELQSDDSRLYCDVTRKYKQTYFNITCAYIFLIMFIPITVIFVSNFVIIVKTFQVFKSSLNQQNETNETMVLSVKNRVNNERRIMNYDNNDEYEDDEEEEEEEEDEYEDENNSSETSELNFVYFIKKNKSKDLNRMARLLLLISFVFALFNLPYFISWCIFFYEVAFQETTDLDRKDYLFVCVQISEIFFVLNYSIQFYINHASSLKFREKVSEFIC